MEGCWLVGWLVGGWVGWLVGWLVGGLVGWLVGWLVGCCACEKKTVSDGNLR